MNQRERLDYLISYFKNESKEYGALEVGDDIDEKRKALRALMNIRMPKELPENVGRVQDEYLRERNNEKGVITLEDILPISESLHSSQENGKNIFLWQGDITRLGVDAIVNAANSQMLGCFIPMHTCIDNAIHTFAGVQLRLECNEKMKSLREEKGRTYEQPTATPIITGGYNLPAKNVIHVVGPIVEGELTEELEEELAHCYGSVLKLCEERGLKSVAFCCISTGVFRFPPRRAAEIAVQTVSQHIKDKDIKVIFNVFKDDDLAIYQNLLR